MISAQDLRDKLKKREAAILDDLDDNEVLFVEYHSPAGAVVRIRDIAYYLQRRSKQLTRNTVSAMLKETSCVSGGNRI